MSGIGIPSLESFEILPKMGAGNIFSKIQGMPVNDEFDLRSGLY
jgi:hypothetical protein